MGVYSPRDYWREIARRCARSDPRALAPVLHPDVPIWFNERIDRLQSRAWSRALRSCQLPPRASVLEVGCGSGRWLRRLVETGVIAWGVDHSVEMLGLARQMGGTCQVVAGEAQHLPFADGTFDGVTCVTVIQHIPPAEQRVALHEVARILKPGGSLLLFELIRGHGLHVFSHEPERWAAEANLAGLNLRSWSGQEFLLLDRLLVGIVQGMRKTLGQAYSDSLPVTSPARGAARQTPAHVAYWAARKAASALSEWTEPLVEKICPDHWATHGVFVFRKEQ